MTHPPSWSLGVYKDRLGHGHTQQLGCLFSFPTLLKIYVFVFTVACYFGSEQQFAINVSDIKLLLKISFMGI